jgi:transposase
LEGERPGRPRRLSSSQEQKLSKDLLLSPREFGYDQNVGDGPLLSHHLEKQFCVHLQVRQCQNLFHRLGFTLQRPRRQGAKADPEQQEAFNPNYASSFTLVPFCSDSDTSRIIWV